MDYKGSYYSLDVKGVSHRFLSFFGRDNCFHYYHIVDGVIVSRINFGHDPIDAEMDFNSEVNFFKERVQNGQS